MKQTIAARADLGMGEGKLAAQVAHASLMAYEDAPDRDATAWKGEGQTKVVVRVDGESALFEINDAAERAGLPSAVVRDAGRTQLASGTATAVAVGPADDDAVDRITGDLPLF